MSKTSWQVKAKYNKKTYKKYEANLRIVEDKELIKFIENNKGKYSITDYLREEVKKLMT